MGYGTVVDVLDGNHGDDALDRGAGNHDDLIENHAGGNPIDDGYGEPVTASEIDRDGASITVNESGAEIGETTNGADVP